MKKMRSMVGVGLLLLAACGGGGDGGDSGGDGAASSTVTMQDNVFAPSDPVIAAGEVELVNEGESPHTFTVEGEAVDVEVDAGQTVTETIDLAPGTYTLFCEFHRAQGMEGTLTVEA
ncbi:MAG TPA: cupredoxin domain-containing protein [Actinomycetota bacterium]|nr:cupredoxin domain-containing protein [Actinomycetota bacterium]